MGGILPNIPLLCLHLSKACTGALLIFRQLLLWVILFIYSLSKCWSVLGLTYQGIRSEGLKEQKLLVSQLWRLEVWGQGVFRTCFETCEGEICLRPLLSFFLKTFFFLLEDNWFTMLWWFLLYNKVNQLWVYIGPFPLELPSHHSPSHPSRSSQSTELGSLSYIAASH